MSKATDMRESIEAAKQRATDQVTQNYVTNEVVKEIFNGFQAALNGILTNAAENISNKLETEVTPKDVYDIIQNDMQGLNLRFKNNHRNTATLIESEEEQKNRKHHERIKAETQPKTEIEIQIEEDDVGKDELYGGPHNER